MYWIPVLFLLIFLPIAHGGVEVWSVTVMHVVSVILFGVWIFRSISMGQVRLYRTPLDIPLLLLVFYLIVSSFLSVYPYASRIQLYRIVNYIVVFYLLINTLRDKAFISQVGTEDEDVIAPLNRAIQDDIDCPIKSDNDKRERTSDEKRIVKFAGYLSILGAIYGFAGLVFIGGNFLGLRIFSSGDLLSFTFKNHNHFAGYMNMITWLSAGMALYHEGKKRIPFLILTLISAMAVFLSLSRGGFIGFFGGLLTFSIISIFSRRRNLFFVSCIVSLLIIVLLLHGGFDVILDRVKTLQRPMVSGADRLQMWKGVLNMIKDNPLIGTGIGTFSYAHPLYQTFEGFRIDHAHNNYLEVVSETGLIGGGLLFICMVMLSLSVIRNLKRSTLSAISIGALSACFSLLIHESFDFNLYIPSNALLFTVCSAMAIVSSSTGIQLPMWFETIPSKRWRLFWCPVVFIMVLTSLALVIAPFIGSFYQNRARVYQASGNYRIAHDLLKRAIWLNSGSAELYSIAGDLMVQMAMSPRYERDRASFLHKAIGYYDEAIKNCPRGAYFYRRKAYSLRILGRFDEAEGLLMKAKSLDRSDHEIHNELAELYLEEGRLEDAIGEFKEYIIKMNGVSYLIEVLDRLWDVTKDYDYLKEVVPDDAGMRDAFANYLWKKGMHDAALKEFAYAYEYAPSVEHALTHIQFLINTSQYNNGYEFCKRYLKMFKDDTRLLNKLAWFSERIGKYEEAISTYGRLINIDPKNIISYRLSMARIYCERIDPSRGIEIINMLRHNASDEPELYHTLAGCYDNIRRYDLALDAMEKALSLNPGNSDYLFQIGFDYRANGMHEKAIESWRECLRINPLHRGCREWVERYEDTHSQ
ncbi:MAG: hypothetical protein Fur0020_00330 [Thermodesulfovibrionia bacterium]